jgi:hypothetical protein
MELGLIGSAWHGTNISVLEGIRKTKENGFDAYDVFEDPLMTSPEEQQAIKDTCAEVGLPIRSAVCIALGLVDFVPAVRRFTLDRCKAHIDQQLYLDELVEEAYLETARILAELGVRDHAGWQPVSST